MTTIRQIGPRIILLTLVFLTVNVLTNQATASDPKQERIRGRNGPPGEEVRKMMDSLKIWKITEELEIDEKLSEKLYPRLNEFEKLNHEGERLIGKSLKKIRQILEAKPGNEKMLEDAVKEYLQTVKAQQEKTAAAQAKILELLTVEQQAKYLIIEEEFPRKIREFLKSREGPGRSRFNQYRGERSEMTPNDLNLPFKGDSQNPGDHQFGR